MMQYPLTLSHLLVRADRYFGNVEIVSRCVDKSIFRYRYADFARRSWRLAEALQKCGLAAGDRVATLMWNHHIHLEAYFGIPVGGYVLHTINPRLPVADIVYILNHAADRILMMDEAFLPIWERIRDQVPVEKIIVVSSSGLADAGRDDDWVGYEDFLATATGDYEPPHLGEDQAAGLCYTSGTTGRPKGVVYSHRSTVLHALVESLPDGLGISRRDTLLPVVPMFHVNAWGLPYAAVLMGTRQVYPGPHLDPVSLLNLFQDERVTITAGVPTIWLAIAQAMEREPNRWDVGGLRMAVGGSAIPPSLIRALESRGCSVTHAWGMTETSPLATRASLPLESSDLTVEQQLQIKAYQGQAVPLVDLRVVRDGQEVPWDGETMGEVQVRGPWVTGEYYRQPDRTDSFTADGWLCTGDIGVLDAAGNLKITDRAKDLIKSGGEWISSVELENALMGHGAVAEAAVIGVSDPTWQERPLAVVVLKTGHAATPEELRIYLGEMFPKWYLPDRVEFVDEIPRTATGKFLKTTLRDRFAGPGT